MSSTRSWTGIACIAVALTAAPLARSGEEGRASDVTPDIALFFNNASEGIALLGRDGILATSGRAGMHRSEDRGRTWIRAMRGLVDPSGIEPGMWGGLCQSPSKPTTVYGIGGGGWVIADRLYRTRDFGRSWTPVASVADFSSTDCAVDAHNPAVIYWLGADPEGNARLYKSTDAGTTLAAVGLGLAGAPGHVRVAPTDRRTVYVSTNQAGIFRSTDGGLHFEFLATLPNAGWIFPHPTRDGILYVTTDTGLMRSTDGGISFAPVPGLPAEAGLLAFDPADPDRIYVAAGLAGLYASKDGGATFAHLPGPAPEQFGTFGVNNVAVGPTRRGRTTLYVGTGLGPHRSDDGGRTFVAIHRGYRGAAVNDLGFDASGRLLVGEMHTVNLLRGDRPGKPGDYEIIGATIPGLYGQSPGGYAIAASPADPDTLVVTTGAGLAYWTDSGGLTWALSAGGPAVPGLFGNTRTVRMAFAPSDPGRVYLALQGGGAPGLYRSDDAGRTFRQTPALPLSTLAVHPTEADVIYAARWMGASGLFRSADGGITFEKLTEGNFGGIAIDPVDPRRVYAGAAGGGGVLRSVDAGATWVSASDGLPPGDVLDVKLDPRRHRRVYAWVRGGGLFRSDDGADSWRAVDTGEALRRSGNTAGRATMVVDPHSGRVYLGNGGVLEINAEREH